VTAATRVVLLSGKGGVGKTTVAAATAVRAAEAGHPTLVVSLDRAHNLGDVLGSALGPEPKRVPGRPRLWAMEADPQAELRRQDAVLHGYFARLLEWAGVASLQADEIAVLPGLEELLVLSRLSTLVASGEHALVVVDLAPTASSLRLLSFPEMMAGPVGKLLAWERRFMKLARPAAKRLFSIPMPEDEAYEAVMQLARRLEALRVLLTDPQRAVVRLVSIPERVVVDETCSAYTLLSLFGLAVDTVVMNRVLPDQLAGTYLDAWTRVQARELERAREQFSGLSLKTLRFQPTEVLGVEALSAVGRELYGDGDPARFTGGASPLRFSSRAAAPSLRLHLPHATQGTLDLKQDGDELIITVGGWRRRLTLPASLHRRPVTGARLAQGTLHIDFAARREPP
jgi:arsenite-transporting ATPase